MKRLLYSVAWCGVLFMAACQLTSPEADFSIIIRSGTSFGECLGYCLTELHLDAQTIIFTRHSSDPNAYPEKRYETPMSARQWQRLALLVDFDVLRQMQEIYGCPDCADGGAEWIDVEQDGQRKRVTFEYGDTLEPIAALVDEVRKIRDQMKEHDEQ